MATNKVSAGVVFDIDGVLVRGDQPIEGAVAVLKQLDSLRIPYVYVTNSGGVPNQEKSKHVSSILGFTIEPEKLIAAHSPMTTLGAEFGGKKVLLVGHKKHHTIAIAEEIGLKNFVLLEDFMLQHPLLCPERPAEQVSSVTGSFTPGGDSEEKIAAVVVLRAPADWYAGLQIIVDVVLSNGHVGNSTQATGDDSKENGKAVQEVPVFIANPDVTYQGKYALPRFTVGAFGVCLKALYKHQRPEDDLNIRFFGKPFLDTYTYAEEILKRQAASSGLTLSTVYGIGDNPLSDIRGANEAGDHWFSILTRTGVFRGEINDEQYPARYVAQDVTDAFTFITQREGLSSNNVALL